MVPNLRFNGYSDIWIKQRLDKNSLIVDGTHQTPEYKDKGIRFVSVENIKAPYTSNKFISEEDYSNYKIKPRIGDIFMTRITAGVIGETYVIDRSDDLAYYVSLALIRPNNQYIKSNFLSYYINSPYFKHELDKRIIKVAFPRKINLNDIGECKISTPTLSEQNKISILLSKIDERIQTQIKIINYLRTQEKHIINNIFNDIESKLYTLTNIAEVYQPKTISSNEFNKDGKYPVFGANGQIGKYDYYNHENEQICISCRGASAGSVNLSQQKSWITGNSMVVNLDNYSNIVNKKFIYYQLKAIDFTKFISGSGQPQITRAALDNLKIKVPSLETQNLLAYTLDLVESKIDLETSICELYQLQKAYLLKNMFI